MPSIRPLPGIELEGAARRHERGVELALIDNQLFLPALIDAPAVIVWKVDGDAAELEASGNMSRECIERAGGLRRQQHISTEIEQPRHLVAPLDRFPGSRLRSSREIARYH